jgi:DNA-binding NarL/FixJ family response regulator
MEVLLVDDQPVTVQVFAAIVRRTFPGVKVSTAIHLAEALQIASGRPIDLVLLDLALPACGGIDALLRFHKAFPSIPVLVVSIYEEPERIRACLDAGARGYVPKTSGVVALGGALRTVAAGGLHVPPQAELAA